MILSLADKVLGVIDKVVPDSDLKQKIGQELKNNEHELTKAFMDYSKQVDHDQAQITLAQTKKDTFFDSGSRPMIMWLCVAAMFYHFLIRPIVSWIGPMIDATIPPLPDIEVEGLMTLLFALLGIGGYRTYEKQKGLRR